MRGTQAILDVYQQKDSIKEIPFSVLEYNANACMKYKYVGYYKGSVDNTYTDTGTTVTNAEFTSKYTSVFRPVAAGQTDTDIAELRYVNEPDEYYDEVFVMDSIVKPHRPDPGIVKWTASFPQEFAIPGTYARIYPPNESDVFKYWRAAADGALQHPFVVYDNAFWVNKIKVSHQTYAGLPRSFKIQYLPEDGSAWTDAYTGTSGDWPSDGVLKIYYRNGAWTQTPNLEDIHDLHAGGVISDAIRIKGLRVVVVSMDAWTTNRASRVLNNNVPQEFVELSPRLALDVSSSLQSFTMTQNLSEGDSPLLVGEVSANSANVILENYSNYLTYGSGSVVDQYNLKAAYVDIYFRTYSDDTQFQTNRVFYGIVSDAEEDNEGNISLEVFDKMKLVQDRNVKNLLLMDKRISEIIRIILDRVGVTGLAFEFLNDSDDKQIPYYYFNSGSAYDALVDIAESYQFAMSYDGDGILRVFSKEKMSDTGSVDFELTYDQSGSTLPNIVEISKSRGKPVNDISINWKPHYVAREVVPGDVGKPLWYSKTQFDRQEAWNGADGEILGAAPLVRTLLKTDTVGGIQIDQEGGYYFDYNGYLKLDDEIIEYDAKEFHTKIEGNTGYTKHWVRDAAEYQELKDKTVDNARFYFTGRLRLKKRGAFNTEVQDHLVDPSATYPYSGSNSQRKFNSWKTGFYIENNGPFVNTLGQTTWRFTSGGVYNLRGTAAGGTESITRNGSESAIRITGVSEWEIRNIRPAVLSPSRDGISSFIVRDNAQTVARSCIHYYNTWAPQSIANPGTYLIPNRVGTKIRLPGYFEGDNEVGPVNLAAAGGVMMWARSSNGSKWLSGIQLEVQASSTTTRNVTIWEWINNHGYIRAQKDINVPLAPANISSFAADTDTQWIPIDLAYYAGLDGNPHLFIGNVGGSTITWAPNWTTTERNSKRSIAYGVFVRGSSTADFDNLWYSTEPRLHRIDGYLDSSKDADIEGYSIADQILEGGGDSTWYTDLQNSMYDPDKALNGQVFGMQEFGPIAHQIRVYRPDFGGSPWFNVDIPRSYKNKSEFKIPIHVMRNFDGELVVVNARKRAVALNGLVLSGYKVELFDDTYDLDDYRKSLGANDVDVIDAQIKASKTLHGLSPLDLSTDLIQTKAEAEDMWKWIVSKNAIDCDFVTAKVLGNPLIEPGDRVTIKYSDIGYSGIEKFVITSVEQSFENGLLTNLQLRRVE